MELKYYKRYCKDIENVEKHPMYGKRHSDESKKKISEAKKGQQHSEATKKKLSEIFKSLRWYNNGEICVRRYECPEGFVPGRLI